MIVHKIEFTGAVHQWLIMHLLHAPVDIVISLDSQEQNDFRIEISQHNPSILAHRTNKTCLPTSASCIEFYPNWFKKPRIHRAKQTLRLFRQPIVTPRFGLECTHKSGMDNYTTYWRHSMPTSTTLTQIIPVSPSKHKPNQKPYEQHSKTHIYASEIPTRISTISQKDTSHSLGIFYLIFFRWSWFTQKEKFQKMCLV